MTNTGTDFWIDDWRVRPSLNRMEQPGRTEQVEPRIMEVLVALAMQPGEVVTREALLETVWADVAVGDDPLNRAISELRKIFGDDPRQPRFIETIRQRGYRLIAAVSHEPPPYLGDGLRLTVDADGNELLGGDVRPLQARPREDGKPAREWPVMLVWGGLVVAFVALALWWRWPLVEDVPTRVVLRPAPFTSYPGREYGADWSPDGNWVAFSWEDSTDRFNIYTKVPSSDTPQQITQGGYDHNPAWSPDGQQIAFMRTWTGCEVRVVAATGGRTRELAPCAKHRHNQISWSPSGDVIAYVNDEDGPAAIFLVDPESRETRRLTTPPAGSTDGLPAFSPDGQHVVFVRSTSLGLDNLYRVPATGGEPLRLTNDNQRISATAWDAPEAIHYTSDRDGAYALMAFPLTDGGPPEWLVAGGDAVHRPTLNLAAQRLVYQQHSLDKNIWRVTLDPEQGLSEPEAFIASTRWDLSPSFSPDGRQIAFMSNRSGSYEIWVADADGSDPARLTDFGGPFVGNPRWSPDGRQIAFDARRDGNADVFVIDTDGGTPRRVTTHAGADVVPAWGQAGASLYVSSNRSGTWQVWRVALAEGDSTATQVTPNGGYAPALSADGNTLYYTKRDVPGLWALDLARGTETRPLARLPRNEWGTWHLIGDAVYFIEHDADGNGTLTYHNLGAGITFAVAPLSAHNPGLTVSPDGRTLLYVQIDRDESDLMEVSLQ